jgi:hydroxymethylglutaryl-CoA lyase
MMSNSQFVTVNDVGPRDGLQNQDKILAPEQRLELISALVDAGVSSIEAVSFVHPKAVPAMAGAGDVVAGLPAADRVDYSALVPNMKGYELAKAAGAKNVALVLSATNTMNEKNINMSLEKTVEVCEEVLRRAAEEGTHARAYVAVAWHCPFEGPTSADVVHGLCEKMFGAGAHEVIIADTIGAANPLEVKQLLDRLVADFGAERLSAHFHDTRAMALANVWAGIESGLRKFDSSIAGLGGCPFAPGAAGNLATEDLVNMLHQMGFETGIDAVKLMTAVDLASQLMERQLGGRMTPWLRQNLKKAS